MGSIPSGNIHTRLIMINQNIPGMIGFATQTNGAGGIHIAGYLNQGNGVIGCNIIDHEDAAPQDVIRIIEAHSGVIQTRTIHLFRD